jgi:hypothetical protein
MLILLAKGRFFWTVRLSGRLLEETHRRTRWKVARIQGPVSVRYQHALKNLRKSSSNRRGQLALTHASSRSSPDWCHYRFTRSMSKTPNYQSILALSNCVVEKFPIPVLAGLHHQYFRGRQGSCSILVLRPLSYATSHRGSSRSPSSDRRKNPITGTARGCACAASGHETAPPK